MGLIGDLQAKLLIHGNVDVMIQDRECHMLPVLKTEFCEAEEDEFPVSWNMPAGYKFIKIIVD